VPDSGTSVPRIARIFLHPPDVQLQVRTLRGHRVQGSFGAPGQVAAEIGFGVLAE
jgi:hypothetical protein